MLCRSVEGTGSGACGPRLNRVINVNIRLALGAKGKFHSSPAGQRVADIITRLIKHYNCKSTEICRVASAALRLSPPDASLTLSLSLSLPVLEILVAIRGGGQRLGGVECGASSKQRKVLKEGTWRECGRMEYGVLISEMLK